MAIYKTLQTGSTGDEVKKLQSSLKSAGYDVGEAGADGIYGPATERAVRRYQTDKGLKVDGIAGEQTQGSLLGSGEKTGEISTGASETGVDNGLKTLQAYDPGTDRDYQQALSRVEAVRQEKPEYEATYDRQLEALYDEIVNRRPFSYNINEDALYQQYKDQYVAQGKLAMQDTMGQAAALTGGYGNSYGQNLGQQAYQGYLRQLNNIVPELYSLAQNRYDQEGQKLMNQYAMLGDMADTEYGRYQDRLNQYRQDLSYAQDQADTAYDRGYTNWYNAYQQQRDETADRQWQAEFDENKRRYDQEWAYAMGKTGGSNSTGDPKPAYVPIQPLYDDGGAPNWYTEGQIRNLQAAAGLPITGTWDPDTEGAYNASGPNYKSIVNDLNTYIVNGAGKRELVEYIDSAYSEGRISDRQHNHLLSEIVARVTKYS